MIHVCIRAAFAAVLCCLASVAMADPVGRYGARTPTVAFDPIADRGLVVYEDGGRIYGKFVDSAGRSAAGGEFQIFPRSLSGVSRYRDPAIVFKSPQNRFYIAARQSYPSRFNLPDGPVVFDTADGIAVTAFDAAGARLFDRTLYTPGFLRSPFTVDAEARPALAADDFADANCCVAVAWEDPRVPDRIVLSRLSPNLDLHDATPQLVPTPTGAVSGLVAVYERPRDRFVFAYDGCTASGRACNGFVTGIAALGAPAPLHLLLPKPANPTPNPVAPAIAYVPQSRRYVLTWRWSTYATASAPARNGTAFAAATSGADGTLTLGTPNFDLGAIVGSCAVCSTTSPADRATIVPIAASTRAMVIAPSATAGRTDRLLAGYLVDSATMAVVGGYRYSTNASYIGRGGAAFSPSGGAIATWQQDVLAGGVDAGVWAGPTMP